MAERPGFSRILATVIVGLAIAIAITLWRGIGSTPAAAPSGPAPPCPERFLDTPARGEALLARLASVPNGAAIASAARQADLRYCFGDARPSMLSGARVLLLDSSLDDADLAARIAHLAHHATQGLPFPEDVPRNADCDSLVSRALRREAQAYTLELSVSRALGAGGGHYEFEADFFAAPAADRERVVLRYLETHPDGGPGLDALASGYRQRCERERGE